jgi:hypothetical protein
MQDQSVPPQGKATYWIHVCGAAGYHGPATLRFQMVAEGEAHFGPIFELHVQFI